MLFDWARTMAGKPKATVPANAAPPLSTARRFLRITIIPSRWSLRRWPPAVLGLRFWDEGTRAGRPSLSRYRIDFQALRLFGHKWRNAVLSRHPIQPSVPLSLIWMYDTYYCGRGDTPARAGRTTRRRRGPTCRR